LGVPHAHELLVGLFWRLALLHNIRVHANIVQLGHIVECNFAILGYIEFVVGLPDDGNAGFTQFSAESPNELVKINLARSIAVKFSKEDLGLIFLKVNAEIFESPHQLVQIDFPVSIIIEDAEDASNSANCHGATTLQNTFDLIHHLVASQRCSDGNGLASGRIARQLNHPEVLLRHVFVHVFTHLRALSFVCKDLSLRLGSSAKG